MCAGSASLRPRRCARLLTAPTAGRRRTRMPHMRHALQEFCNGGSLREALMLGVFGGGPDALPRRWAPITAVLRGLAEGLAYVHGQSIVHGDVNPANILLQVRAPYGMHAYLPGAPKRAQVFAAQHLCDHPAPRPTTRSTCCWLHSNVALSRMHACMPPARLLQVLYRPPPKVLKFLCTFGNHGRSTPWRHRGASSQRGCLLPPPV